MAMNTYEHFAVNFPAWLLMWGLAALVYTGCKVLTVFETVSTSTQRLWTYLLAWPGMNAREFFNTRPVRPVDTKEWFAGSVKLITGAIILWALVRAVPSEHDLFRGWVGMLGLILILHFGLFQLLSLVFRNAGIDAAPLMNEPLKARSVAEFWNKRWNTAFNQLANRLTFRKVVGKIGVTAAVLLTFAVSGLVHDLVISIPAGGGYGLPTVYFLIQGIAVVVERSSVGRAIGLGHGVLGRAFAIAVTAVPAFWLFHSMFVRNVILPFLRAIGCW
jgi:hypothetical protein